MKRCVILCAVICASLCAFCSCSDKPSSSKPVTLSEKFTVTAQFTNGDLSACADMTRIPEGWEITMTAPERVEGLTFELTEMECTARFSELTYPFATETMPDSSPLLLTARALDKCVLKSNTGTVSGQNYSLTCTDGKPDTLQIGSMTVTLTDYKPR